MISDRDGGKRLCDSISGAHRTHATTARGHIIKTCFLRYTCCRCLWTLLYDSNNHAGFAYHTRGGRGPLCGHCNVHFSHACFSPHFLCVFAHTHRARKKSVVTFPPRWMDRRSTLYLSANNTQLFKAKPACFLLSHSRAKIYTQQHGTHIQYTNT